MAATTEEVSMEKVDCVDETTTFTSVLDCVFVGDADELTDDELNITVSGVKNVYNNLQSQSVCDQLFRAITHVSLPEEVEVADDGTTDTDKDRNILLRYKVTGNCRGCPDPLLFEDSINRDPSSSRALMVDDGTRTLLSFLEEDNRELETMKSCTCPVGAEQRGLVQSDFVDGYNVWIENKREEGKLSHLRELLRLTEEGSFPTEAQAPSSGARLPTWHKNNIIGSLSVSMLYSVAVIVLFRKMF